MEKAKMEVQSFELEMSHLYAHLIPPTPASPIPRTHLDKDLDLCPAALVIQTLPPLHKSQHTPSWRFLHAPIQAPLHPQLPPRPPPLHILMGLPTSPRVIHLLQHSTRSSAAPVSALFHVNSCLTLHLGLFTSAIVLQAPH
jgi:hypothetical protein